MHRLQGCLVDRSYAGCLDYRLDVSVVRNCVILDFFDCYFDCYSVCIFSFVGYGCVLVLSMRVTGTRLGQSSCSKTVKGTTPAVCTAAHSALLAIIMHSRQCIIMANNALWAAGVVVFTVLLHDKFGLRVGVVVY